jgi:hypothetical protein
MAATVLVSLPRVGHDWEDAATNFTDTLSLLLVVSLSHGGQLNRYLHLQPDMVCSNLDSSSLSQFRYGLHWHQLTLGAVRDDLQRWGCR